MQTMEETRIIVSLCNMTLSELIFSYSESWMWDVWFDKIFDELNKCVFDGFSSRFECSDANLTEDGNFS